ncbi:hypothetical protein HF086_016385, partial [Spodoptera exigua]
MLLKNYSACQKILIEIEDERVYNVADGIWLLFSKINVILTENCNDEIIKYNLKGTFLVNPNPNCETQIGSRTINKVTETPELSLQLRPVTMHQLQQKITTDGSQIDLRGVDLSDIKDILESAKYDSESVGKSEIVITKDISVWTISLVVIMTLLALVFVIVKFNVFRKYLPIHRNHLEPKELSPADFSLKGGGVKGPNPIDICFIDNISLVAMAETETYQPDAAANLENALLIIQPPSTDTDTNGQQNVTTEVQIDNSSLSLMILEKIGTLEENYKTLKEKVTENIRAQKDDRKFLNESVQSILLGLSNISVQFEHVINQFSRAEKNKPKTNIQNIANENDLNNFEKLLD